MSNYDDRPAPTPGLEPGTTEYDTGSKVVSIKQRDHNWQPTVGWLQAEDRASRSGGPYGTEVNSARIAELVACIRSFDYDRVATPIQFAAKWGISARYVRILCAEAMKVVREEVTDAEYVTTTVCEALDKVIRTNIKNPKVGNQKLVVQAAKVWAEISGVRAPVEIRLGRSGADGLPDDIGALRALAARMADPANRLVAFSVVEEPNGNTEAPPDTGGSSTPVAPSPSGDGPTE